MKETILIISEGNEPELLRTMAMHGAATFALRVMNPLEFARYALMQSGYAVVEDYISSVEQSAILAGILPSIPYFRDADISDTARVSAAMDDLRMLIPENEAGNLHEVFPRGPFPLKNAALLEVYDAYISELGKLEKMDSVGILRCALEHAKPMDAALLLLKDHGLRPLELFLVKTLSKQAMQFTTLPQLLGKETEPVFDIEHMIEAYGATNEVQNVIGQIYGSEIPLDRCVVALTDTSAVSGYVQRFYDYAQTYDIPITFGCGVPIRNSNPAKLLLRWSHWKEEGCGLQVLREMIFSEAFHCKRLKDVVAEEGEMDISLAQLIRIAGELKLSERAEQNSLRIMEYARQQPDENRTIAWCLSRLAGELEKGCEYFVTTYAAIRAGYPGRLDISANATIRSTFGAYRTFGNVNIREIMPVILQKNVCCENSQPGALHVVGLEAARFVQRKQLFVVGLSADIFPGSTRENDLLLDDDYRLFTGNIGAVRDSVWRINHKKDLLFEVLHLATALKLNTSLSYAGYHVARLKGQNASSVLLNIYRNSTMAGNQKVTMQAFRDAVEQVGFFRHMLSAVDVAGVQYLNGEQCQPEMECVVEKTTDYSVADRRYSPTAIEKWLKCPRSFYLRYILGVHETESVDPLQVISAADLGTIVHEIMETRLQESVDERDFIQVAQRSFDQFVSVHPALVRVDASRVRNEFLGIMRNAYRGDPGNRVVAAEDTFAFQHPTGIWLEGRPDRIEQLTDGRTIVVDYKTGRTLKHEQDNVKSCIQTVIYAWLTEQNGYAVDHCEYRYLRLGHTVTCHYDQTVREQLDRILAEFRTSLESGVFPMTEDAGKACRYCAYAGYCQTVRERGGE